MAEITPVGSGGMSLSYLNETVYQGMRAYEVKLRETLARIGNNPDGSVSQTDLLMMQQEVQQWTMMVDVQSTITKQISDSLKSVIQKSA
ncbi:MAG: EscF/YscF/HrpA family type III secretion system needle major subunit [Candidimonas sp.]|jgi:type III secretion protein F